MTRHTDNWHMERTLWEYLRDVSQAAIDLLDNQYTEDMSLQLVPKAQEILDNLKVLHREQGSKKHE